MSKTKKIIFALLFITLIFTMGMHLFSYDASAANEKKSTSKQFRVSSVPQLDELGNSTANSNNLGIAAEGGKYNFYINQETKKIVRMDSNGKNHLTLISDIAAKNLNVINNWLYYTDNEEQTICKIKFDGTENTTIASDLEVSNMQITEDGWIYFNNNGDSKKLYKIKTDGSKLQKMTNEKVGEFIVFTDRIAFQNLSKGNKLYEVMLDDLSIKKITNYGVKALNYLNGKYYFSKANSKNYYYSLDSNGKKLTLIRKAATNNAAIKNGKLYFVSSNKKIYTQNLAPKSSKKVRTVVKNKDAKWIGVAGNYVYFTPKTLLRSGMYMGKLSGTTAAKLSNTTKTLSSNIRVKSITLNAKKNSINVGETFQLSATIIPSNATNKTVFYTSSSPEIATIDDYGNIKGLSVGTTTITAETEDGSNTAFCEVTVTSGTQAPISATFRIINKTGSSIVDLYIADSTLTEYGEDLLTKNNYNSISNGKYIDFLIEFDQNTSYDFYMRYADGSESEAAKLSFKGATLKGGTITLTKNSVELDLTKFAETNKDVPVTSIKLNYSNKNLKVGEFFSLIPTISPSNATTKTVTYTSSSPSIATVDAVGNVIGIKTGTTKITVRTTDGKKAAYCTVSVSGNTTNVAVTSVKLDSSSKSIRAGESFTLVPTISPSNATNKAVTYTSSSPTVATVDKNGIVNGLRAGTAKIAVTTQNGSKTAYCTVTVTNVPNTQATSAVFRVVNNTGKSIVDLYIADSTLTEYGNDLLSTNNYTSFSNGKYINFKIDFDQNTSYDFYMRYSDGTESEAAGLSFKGATSSGGTINLTKDSVTLTLSDTPIANEIDVTSISLQTTIKSLKVNETFKLIATVYPSSATNKSVTYTSSSPTIAAVDSNGNITGKKAGIATITVKSLDGKKSATCKVTVTAEQNLASATFRVINHTGLSIVDLYIADSSLTEYGDDLLTKNGYEVVKDNEYIDFVIYFDQNTSYDFYMRYGDGSESEAAGLSFKGATSKGGNITLTKNSVVLDPSGITPVDTTIGVTGLTLDVTNKSIKVEETFVLTGSITPSNATNKTVTYQSSAPDVASIDANGNIKGLKPGTAVITVTTQDGNKSASCTVTVTQDTKSTVNSATFRVLNNTGLSIVDLYIADSAKSSYGDDLLTQNGYDVVQNNNYIDFIIYFDQNTSYDFYMRYEDGSESEAAGLSFNGVKASGGTITLTKNSVTLAAN